jgi:hypothetical protein
MSSCFDEQKTAQIVARFLGHTNGRDNYTKIIKLLYLTDREALKEWNHPLTGDRYVWMSNGPVLSRVLDLIHGQKSFLQDSSWDYWFVTDGYDICIKDSHDPGQDRLSDAEKELIDSLSARFAKYSYCSMIDYTHTLPECPDQICKDSPPPNIGYQKLLIAIGKGQQATQLAEDIEDINYLRSQIGAC